MREALAPELTASAQRTALAEELRGLSAASGDELIRVNARCALRELKVALAQAPTTRQ